MKVLFLMLAFPDMNKSFNMFTAIVEEFHKNNHEVYVVAPGGNSLTEIRKEKEINVLRVKTLPVKNIPNILKGISNILLPYQYDKAIRKYYSSVQFDLIVSPTPPVTLVNLVSKLKKKNKAPFYLILRDIFPQNAVDLDFMKKDGLIYKYFRRKEKKLYRTADHIGCMSEANIQYILKHNPTITLEKLHVLQNYQILYRSYGTSNPKIKSDYNLEGKFVVVFGGNMGKPQQIENVLMLARYCEKYNDVVFLLLGEGLQKKSIEEKIKKDNHRNVQLLNSIPKHLYQQLISGCDIGLISLHKNFTIPNIPSKTLDYFNVGIPVLASIDKATDYGILLEIAGAGLWSFAGNHNDFNTNFDYLYSSVELRKRMGENGRKYFEEHLTPDKAYQTVINRVSKPS
jgi:glycosyltransferase involved in cell wall biosynthesis